MLVALLFYFCEFKTLTTALLNKNFTLQKKRKFVRNFYPESSNKNGKTSTKNCLRLVKIMRKIKTIPLILKYIHKLLEFQMKMNILDEIH